MFEEDLNNESLEKSKWTELEKLVILRAYQLIQKEMHSKLQ